MKKANDLYFRQLQALLTDFSFEATKNKTELLKQCSLIKIMSKKCIEQYHNNLLFILSYAQNAEIYLLAHKEMLRITELIQKNVILKDKLTGSGIAGASIQGAYSLTLINWLLKQFSQAVSIHSFDETGTHPKEILKHTLPEAEFEILSNEKLNALKWLGKASGTNNGNKKLLWLIQQINVLKADDLIKDQLFESLKLYVEIKPEEKYFSRSFGTIKTENKYFHSDGLTKRFNEKELINKKLPQEKRLSSIQKEEIIKASRIALCLLNRETDPISYCEELNIKYFELERGLSVALFSIDKERRLPIESYIGFMMFKNGYPMSYGGAWLFGQRSLIGINIFDAFRGGESAIVFAQLLRCYKMEFGANYFEVEPYQFGKNNPEGIQSGAFWFYYRFGFKPCDKKLAELALSEHQKISAAKGYRTSAETLRQFTKSNVFVDFSNNKTIPLNPANLSKFVTTKINNEFNGNRTKARQWCLQKLKQEKIINKIELNNGLNKLCWFFAMCLDWRKISSKEKAILQQLIHTKDKSEFDYVKLLLRFPFEKLLIQ